MKRRSFFQLLFALFAVPKIQQEITYNGFVFPSGASISWSNRQADVIGDLKKYNQYVMTKVGYD